MSDLGDRYPDLVREAIRFLTDAPFPGLVRVDPDGERRAQERQRFREESLDRHRGGSEPPIPTKIIWLQWFDEQYGTWHDAPVTINLDDRTIDRSGALLGRPRGGSGMIGIVLFALPALIVLSPWLWLRHRWWRSRERKHGMPYGAIVLLEKLKGQLDAETEALFREALQRTWQRDRKLSRTVTFLEAEALLDACALKTAFEPPQPPDEDGGDPDPSIGTYLWTDADGDQVAMIMTRDDRVITAEVLGSSFGAVQGEALLGRYGIRLQPTVPTGASD